MGEVAGTKDCLFKLVSAACQPVGREAKLDDQEVIRSFVYGLLGFKKYSKN